MSGHNKWSSIKHKKGAADAKRGKIFTKLIKEISAAARNGADPSTNARLRTAIANAKAANMPNDNVTRAIKKGSGETGADNYETITYEGYGPGGTAIMINTLTDNKNRTVSEIRHIFSRSNGNLGESGCVAWMFNQKGLITIEDDKTTEDVLMEVALEAGADDVVHENGFFDVYTETSMLETVRAVLEAKDISIDKAELSMEPQTTVKLTGKDAENMLKLMEKLEDHDDVQNVYSNFEIDDEEMDALISE